MFESVDLSSNFYYSHTYDLTHTLQYNMTRLGHVAVPCSGSRANLDTAMRMFVWNDYLLQPLCEHLHSRWIVPIIHGFVTQVCLATMSVIAC
jgi:phosphatidylinositol 3,5-bisphosphate 5-phosphatase